jgi:hypothetical protein
MPGKVRRAGRKSASKVGKRLTGRKSVAKRVSYKKSRRGCGCGR